MGQWLSGTPRVRSVEGNRSDGGRREEVAVRAAATLGGERAQGEAP